MVFPRRIVDIPIFRIVIDRLGRTHGGIIWGGGLIIVKYIH